MAEGPQTFRVGVRDYVVRQGEVFITQPDEEHGTGLHPRERGLLYWLQVRARRNRTFLGQPWRAAAPLVDALSSLRTHRHFTGTPSLRALFEELLELSDRDGPDPVAPLVNLRFASTMQRLLLNVVTASKAPLEPGPHNRMNTVLEFIEAHLGEPLSTTVLAQVAGLSPSWFKARFREEVGLPPADYVARRRIQEARGLLESGRHTVTDVAFMLAFSSSQNFATVFRRYTSQRPRECLRRNAASLMAGKP
jgi:AraC-like DNA-binding protein